jgi:DNA-binding response OmpR family regulator
MKILFIDDEPDILEVVSSYIVEHECHLKSNTKDALEALETFKYDLVIVDFLPRLGTLEILDACQATKTESVIFTGNYELEKLNDCNVILKPNIDVLICFIENLCKVV